MSTTDDGYDPMVWYGDDLAGLPTGLSADVNCISFNSNEPIDASKHMVGTMQANGEAAWRAPTREEQPIVFAAARHFAGHRARVVADRFETSAPQEFGWESERIRATHPTLTTDEVRIQAARRIVDGWQPILSDSRALGLADVLELTLPWAFAHEVRDMPRGLTDDEKRIRVSREFHDRWQHIFEQAIRFHTCDSSETPEA